MSEAPHQLNLISLGCAKNLVDSERILGGVKNSHIRIVEEPEEADTIVVNTCGFLDQAREESVEVILQAASLKKTGRLKQLVVMGCLSERYPQELAKSIPEVDRFFGTRDHGEIISFLTGKSFNHDDPLYFRSLLTPDHYAYVKIGEGCDNGCSFCSIPIMRGKQRSRSISSIMDECERLVDRGVKELLVIAQDTTTYGWDLPEKVHLGDLIRTMDGLGGDLKWIRIHYAHPAHLSQKIIDAMATSEKMCRYLDLPIQHASDRLLVSMRRGLGADGIRDRIKKLRDALPNLRLRTTVIVGYPGETEDDFQSLVNFIREIQFDRLGVFTYSEEEGTLAADLRDDISRQVKDERKALLMDIQNEISTEKNARFIGSRIPVLVDEAEKNHGVGRSEFDSPEIDNIVHIQAVVRTGDFLDVQIHDSNAYELIGTPVN